MKYLILFILAAVPSCEDEFPQEILECVAFDGLDDEQALEEVSWNPEFHEKHSSLWALYGEPEMSYENNILLFKYGNSDVCLKILSSCELVDSCD